MASSEAWAGGSPVRFAAVAHMRPASEGWKEVLRRDRGTDEVGNEVGTCGGRDSGP